MTNLVASFTPGSTRNNYGGYVGLSFVVGTNPLTVSQLGAMMGDAGNTSVVVYLSNAAGSVLASATVTFGGTVGTFYYTSIAPVPLAAGANYWLTALETNGGQLWANAGNVTLNSIGNSPGSPFSPSLTSWQYSSAGQMFVGVDLVATTGTAVISATKLVTTNVLSQGDIRVPKLVTVNVLQSIAIQACKLVTFVVLQPGTNVTLTGVQTTSGIGSLTVVGSSSVNLTGVSTTSQVGSLSVAFNATVTLSGVTTTGHVGTLQASPAIGVSGVAATSGIGSVTTASTYYAYPIGVAAVGAVGALAVTRTFSITGVQTVVSVGTPIVQITGNMTNVALAGLSSAVHVGAFDYVTAVELIGLSSTVSVALLGGATVAEGMAMSSLTCESPATSSDRSLTLTCSATGGASWQTPRTQILGGVGVTNTSVQFRRLPQARSLVFQLQWSGIERAALLGAFLEFTDSAT